MKDTVDAGNTMPRAGKREVQASGRKGLLSIQDLMLAVVLLAAGAVLKFTVGNIINFGMKPNFIIAMYCLAILLIRPRLAGAAVIGVLAGAVCQFFPGTPYINIVSEAAGAIAMCLLVMIPLRLRNQLAANAVGAAIPTFISTLVSGFIFLGLMWALFFINGSQGAAPTALVVFLGIIFGTAAINTVLVVVLYPPLKKALKR